jgi:hypothetical protein
VKEYKGSFFIYSNKSIEMDPVINSLVQSPLVRSMSTVPSKASSFVHGVRDNVPPFSFQKVVVQPWNNPSTTTQDQSHKFRIPQFGTLNRAYLRIKMKNQIPTDTNSLKILESDYDTMHDRAGSDSVVPADASYTTLKQHVRIPWIHPTQMQTKVSEVAPLGGGGSAGIHGSALSDPESLGTLLNVTTKADLASHLVITQPDAFFGKSSNAWNVINILDEMRLTTNGKLIETVYGETIPAEVVKMPAGLRDYYIRGMVGWSRGDFDGKYKDSKSERHPWDPSACHRDAYGRLSTQDVLDGADVQGIMNENQHAEFVVPVTLSSLKMLSKNYQTRFVEDLELEVKMKSIGRGFNEFLTAADLNSHHEVELVLIYHNWHDNIENTIRNSNYKRGVPASVYSTNWVKAATTAPAVSNTLPLSIPLTSRNLVTEMLVVAKSKSCGAGMGVESLKRRKSDYTVALRGEFNYGIELKGSGKTIWSGDSSELCGPDSADYDLTERRLSGGDVAYGGLSRLAFSQTSQGGDVGSTIAAGGNTTFSNNLVTQCGVDYSFGDNMSILRFGFQTTDEFYSGGIALQTISNPTIVITPYKKNYEDWVDKEVEFEVYVKHANLVRIDSDTGAVTRTLDV